MFNFGFVMEQTLGHITHHANLAHWVETVPDICPTWMPITVAGDDLWERVPGVRQNWSLKASLRARDAVKSARHSEKFDALFFHTQTTALFSVSIMKQIPAIVSLDATPLNYDVVGAAYGHIPGKPNWLEHRKYLWNRATFESARHLITWCQWAKDSLIADYGIAGEKITVIPPGVDMEQWEFGRHRAGRQPAQENRTRLLFVGGDFARKGGNLLLSAFRSGLQDTCELDIVTREEQAEQACADLKGVRVHRGLTANSEALKELYRQADIFVFPTLADCLPIAVMEAMAAGLPIITTDVGALREEVEEGVNGLIIPPGDADAIIAAVRSLNADGIQRQAMSLAGRRMAEVRFNAGTNYMALLDLMKRISR